MQLLFVTWTTQSVAELQRPWSRGLGQAVASGVASNAASHPSGQNRVLSVLSLEMFAETTGHASTHSLQEDIKN